MYVADARTAVWDTLVAAFEELRAEGSPRAPPQAAQTNGSGGATSVGTLLFHLLYLAARLWRADTDAQFQAMVQAALGLARADADMIELLRLETLGHHKQPMTRAFSDMLKKTVAPADPQLHAAMIVCWYFSRHSISPLNTAVREYKVHPKSHHASSCSL